MKNSINQNVNVKLVSIAAPPPEQLDFIVRIANCSSRRCCTLTKAMTGILGLIKTYSCQLKFKKKIPRKR
jgi:hypothetical protein